MARSNHIYNSFIAGEISPKFFGRVDTAQYNQALEETKNVVVYPQGGFGRRPGSIYRKRLYKSDGTSNPSNVRLIPFSASDGTRWQLVITDELCTAVHPPPIIPAVVLDPAACAWKAINVATGATEGLVHFDMTEDNGHFEQYYDLNALDINLSELQYAQSGDTLIITHGKMRPIKVIYDPSLLYAGTAFYFTPFPVPFDGATTTTSIAAAGDNYKEMPMLPSGDTLSEGVFSVVADRDLAADAPNGGINNVLLTFTFLDTSVELNDTWLGRTLRLSLAANTIVLQIYNVASTTTAHARVLAGTMAADPSGFTSDVIERGFWDDHHGWPKSVVFYESRLVFGGTDYFPDYEWFSQINDIREFSVRKLEQDPDFASAVLATDPFIANLKSNTTNKVRWMLASKTIQVGTNFNEFIVKGPDDTLAIGPTNYTSSPEMNYGSAYVQALRFGSTTIFVQRDRRTLREMVFNFNEDQFNADDLSFIVGHILDRSAEARVDEPDSERQPVSSIVAMAGMQCPHNQIWALDTNGMLTVFTRERRQEVAAWTYCEIAGETLITNGDAENVAFKPFVQSISSVQRPLLDDDGTGGEPDELWMAVARGITEDSVTYTKGIFIESMAREWDRPRIDRDWDFANFIAPVYMDCTVMWSSTSGATGVITGLPHGENAVVTVLLDGGYKGTFTVDASGEIDISAHLSAAQIAGTTAWNALVGFNYLAYAVPVSPEVPANTGSSQGQTRRIDQIVIHFYRSIGCKFGRKTNEYEQYTPRHSVEEITMPSKVGADAGAVAAMYTGDKKLNFPQGYERRPQVYIESHLPLPMTVTHAVARMVVYEG